MTETGDTSRGFYDSLAEHYHLIFEDWDRAIERQAAVLNALIASRLRPGPLKILDCACGIGTQSIGFAQHGHAVVASDLSASAIARARREANLRGLRIAFQVSDMTSLAEIAARDFDVVAALDNALPHLSVEQTITAVRAMYLKLKPGGLLLASIRDYDLLIEQRPTIQQPAFYGKEGERRIVHQVWDWIDRERYAVHLYITVQAETSWTTHHFVSEYRCLLGEELTRVLASEGFYEIQWLMPSASGYYQPTVVARSGINPCASK